MSCKKLLCQSILPLLLLFAAQFTFAQDKTVTGKVTDSKDGSPVARASVQVKGSGTGTTTGDDGTFRLSVGSGVTTLVFSSVGFENQEINISGKTEVAVSLVSLSTGLGEVVVVGYGTQKKREVTSAITTVTSEQFNKGNISDVAQLLQGKVAGLSISRPGGDPNGGFVLRLRGLSTIGANTSPLIVLDGQIGADINTVDPNDIKSIDILKDGSAAAIYGTRGSQGVIIITTKTGKGGPAQVNYNGTITAEDPFRFTKHMSAAEFRALGKGTDYGSSTDWNKEITRTAISTIQNLSLSGGSGGTNYHASMNYRKAQGVAIRTGFEQLNARLNLSQRAIHDKLLFNIEVSTTRRTGDLGFPDAFKYATIFNPTAPVHSTDPLYDLTGGGYFESNLVDYSNPVAMLEQNKNNQEIKRLNIMGSGEYEIVKGLKFLMRYASQANNNFRTAYLRRDAFISRNFLGQTGVGRQGYAYRRDEENNNQLFESTLSYDGKITSRLNLNAVGGYSYQNYVAQGFEVRAGNFVTDGSQDNLGAALDFVEGLATGASYRNRNKIIGFFGRINLNYDNIAFLSASLRREGSSKFGANNRWGSFPAVSGGLDIKRIVTLPEVINNLKLRASYGVTGAPPNDAYLSLERLTTAGRYYAGNGVYQNVYAGTGNPNPDLKWERKSEIDIGLDFTLFGSRLNGTLDYFRRNTSDLIFNVTVPSPPNLFNTTWKNIGKLENNGFEAAVNYDVLRGRLFWNTGLTYSSYNIFLAELDESLQGSYVGATNLGTPGQEATQLTRAVQGEPIGLLYGYKYLGVDANGKYLFDDGTGKGVTSANNPVRGYIGNGLPDFEFSWTNTLRYGQFDLNFFLRGSIGHQMINTFRAFYENPNIATSYNVVNTKYFNPDIDDAQIYSSLHVEKASFVKLDNATIGYTANLPKTGSWSAFRSVRIYFTGQNLFTITNYTGVDPEVRYQDQDTNGANVNVLAPGIDRRETWVYTRSFTLGLNLGF